MTVTAVKEKPTKSTASPATGPASTGQIELETDLLISVVETLKHIVSDDDSRPILNAVRIATNEDGTGASFYATDSYKMAKLTVECEATPRLTALLKFDPPSVKRLRDRRLAVNDTIIRIGRVGEFKLSSAGNWTGRGAHMATTGDRIAFAEVIDTASTFNFDDLLAKTKLRSEPTCFLPSSLLDITRACHAWSEFGPIHFEQFGGDDQSYLWVDRSGYGKLEIAAMPVRVS